MMPRKVCTGKCVGGPGRSAINSTMIPRAIAAAPRPRSAGPTLSRTQIPQPQYSRTRLGPYGQVRPIMQQPTPSRPRTALPVIRRGQTPTSTGTTRRQAARDMPVPRRLNAPVPYGQRLIRPSSRSGIPCPRANRYNIIQRIEPPIVTLNTRMPRHERIFQGNDININIRLTIESPSVDDYEAKELEEFEKLERDLEDLDEFERLERQCELECANSGGPPQVLDVVPLAAARTGRGSLSQNLREYGNIQKGISAYGTLRNFQRQQDIFDALASQAAATPDISSCTPPEFESPVSESALYDSIPGWDSLANQPGSLLADESMSGNPFDRGMWEDSDLENSEDWNRLVAAADDSRYNLGNVSFNYESPGCC